MTDLAALQREERSIAVAAVECEEGVSDERFEIRAEYERAYIEANSELIERVRVRDRG